jgi:chromate reductase
MTPFNAQLLQAPEVLIASSAKAFDEEGALIDERSQAGLDRLMIALREAADKGT